MDTGGGILFFDLRYNVSMSRGQPSPRAEKQQKANPSNGGNHENPHSPDHRRYAGGGTERLRYDRGNGARQGQMSRLSLRVHSATCRRQSIA
jgi:hypothetical protein